MNAIETGIALGNPWAVRNGKLTGKAQLLADAVTGIEAYARKGRFHPKRTAYRLAIELARRYGFSVSWSNAPAEARRSRSLQPDVRGEVDRG